MKFHLGVGEEVRHDNERENSENIKLTPFLLCIFLSFRNISANNPSLITISFTSQYLRRQQSQISLKYKLTPVWDFIFIF